MRGLNWIAGQLPVARTGFRWQGAWLIALVCWPLLTGEACAIGFGSIGRDAFPVFDDPPMLSATEAEAAGAIHPRDAVIGVAHNGEAKAYPIRIMGVHELGNDTIGGLPIAVSW